MQVKVHRKFWNTAANVRKFITNSNAFLEKPVSDDNGGEKLPHFVIMPGCCEDKTDIKDGFFVIDIEIDEKLFGELIDRKGQIKIGASFVKLIGGGMVHAAKTKIREDFNKVIDNAANVK